MVRTNWPKRRRADRDTSQGQLRQYRNAVACGSVTCHPQITQITQIQTQWDLTAEAEICVICVICGWLSFVLTFQPTKVLALNDVSHNGGLWEFEISSVQSPYSLCLRGE